MNIIYKYNLNYHSVPEVVELPLDAEIINFAIQNGDTVMWALVNPEETKKEKRLFILAMTGQEFKGKVKHVYNSAEDMGIVLTLLEVSDVKGFDPKKDERLNN